MFRRRARRDAPPPGIEVPDGMVAVPQEEMLERTTRLVGEASEMAGTHTTPGHIDLYAKVVLRDICGERAEAMPYEASFLAYQLVVLGYWCRVVEMNVMRARDGAEAVAELLGAARQEQRDWFAAVNQVAYALANPEAQGSPLLDDLRSELPQDFGAELQGYLCLGSRQGVLGYMSDKDPDAARSVTELLSEREQGWVWRIGYWHRVIEASLPQEASAELARDAQAGAS